MDPGPLACVLNSTAHLVSHIDCILIWYVNFDRQHASDMGKKAGFKGTYLGLLIEVHIQSTPLGADQT